MSFATITVIILDVIAALLLVGLAMAVKIVKQCEQGALFRLGKVQGIRAPGLRVIVPVPCGRAPCPTGLQARKVRGVAPRSGFPVRFVALPDVQTVDPFIRDGWMIRPQLQAADSPPPEFVRFAAKSWVGRHRV